MDRVFVVPEPPSDPQISYSYSEVLRYDEETRLFPQDIAILESYVFVLDFYKGVFVFELLNHKLVPRMKMELNALGGNHRFRIYHRTIFVNFNDLDGSKIA